MTKHELKENLEWLKSRKQQEYRADQVIDKLSVDTFASIGGMFTDWEAHFVRAIKQSFNDADWLEYWIYDLNFGENAKEDSVKIDGKNIPITTVEDLYNLLTM